MKVDNTSNIDHIFLQCRLKMSDYLNNLVNFRCTCEYLNPKVETIPPVQPIKSAPNGLTGIEAHAEIAVPPAKVAFWTWLIVNFDSSDEAKDVM